jgi:hypothetical protein
MLSQLFKWMGFPIKAEGPPAPTPWMTWMDAHMGQPEVTGGPATNFDNEIFSHTDFGSLNGIMEPGCAATACAALEENGFLSPHSAAAISFKDYGTPCELVFGCIVVFQWENGEHHVTFCESFDDIFVTCLGGNQSQEVKESTFYRQYIIATRWPVS